MRTWKCPDCGHTETISYDWLAQHGGPVCQQCDCDMELEPESAGNEADVRRTVPEAKRNEAHPTENGTTT